MVKPRAFSPVRLTQFLRSRQRDILARWEAAVRALPSAREIDQLTLIDHLPALLDRIAENAARGAPDPGPAAASHSLHRLEEGFDLAEAVIELGMLRDCVLGLWQEEIVGPMHVADLRTLDRALDRAIFETVEQFTLARDRALSAIDRIVTAAFESTDLTDLLRRLLAVLVETTPAVDTAAILLREGDHMIVRATVGLEREVEEGLAIPIGQGFAGAIAASAAPKSLRMASKDTTIESPVLRRLGLQSLYGVPLVDGTRVIGVAHMGSLSAPDFSREDKRLFSAMAARATAAIVQHMLRERAERAAVELHERERQLRFLDEATALLSSTLDYHDTLERVAQLAVPNLADWCAVDLIAGERLRRVAIAHQDPAKLEAARTYASRYPEQPEMGVQRVIATGAPTFAPVLTPAVFTENVHDPEQRAMLAALGLHSAIIVPLTARGRVLGAISLLMSDSPRTYQQADLDTALELGRRAGIAVDNARLYHEAQQAVRLREDVLAIVSHDLRNPLGAIDLSASMMLQRNQDPRIRKQLEIIRRSTGRMEHLITDLLDMASIQAGRLSLDKTPSDAGRLVAEIADTHAPLAAEKQLVLTARTQLDGVTIMCDRERIAQVFGNLISNAIKFCRPGDHIELTGTSDGAGATFAVHDTGPGIPPEELPHIFEPYWSAKRHATKGTGLGLYICKGIVEAHGGTLEVASTPGSGATFTLTLPLA